MRSSTVVVFTLLVEFVAHFMPATNRRPPVRTSRTSSRSHSPPSQTPWWRSSAPRQHRVQSSSHPPSFSASTGTSHRTTLTCQRTYKFGEQRPVSSLLAHEGYAIMCFGPPPPPPPPPSVAVAVFDPATQCAMSSVLVPSGYASMPFGPPPLNAIFDPAPLCAAPVVFSPTLFQSFEEPSTLAPALDACLPDEWRTNSSFECPAYVAATQVFQLEEQEERAPAMPLEQNYSVLLGSPPDHAAAPGSRQALVVRPDGCRHRAHRVAPRQTRSASATVEKALGESPSPEICFIYSQLTFISSLRCRFPGRFRRPSERKSAYRCTISLVHLFWLVPHLVSWPPSNIARRSPSSLLCGPSSIHSASSVTSRHSCRSWSRASELGFTRLGTLSSREPSAPSSWPLSHTSTNAWPRTQRIRPSLPPPRRSLRCIPTLTSTRPTPIRLRARLARRTPLSCRRLLRPVHRKMNWCTRCVFMSKAEGQSHSLTCSRCRQVVVARKRRSRPFKT